jgi:hypothetical protein
MRRSRALLAAAAAVVATSGIAVWVALPASAAATTAVFTKTSDWGTGWQGQYTITNGGSAPITSWKIEFDLPTGTAVGGYWDAVLATKGQHVTATNREWNGTVAPGATVSFGFLGTGTGSPTDCKLNGASCTGAGAPVTTPAKPTGGPTAEPAPTTAGPGASPSPVRPDPTAAAGTDLLPLTLTNNSGRNEALHLYVLGEKDRRLGYVNQAGAFTPWTGGGDPPVPAPDVSIAGPAGGASITLQIPRGLSGRVYFAFRDKLKFGLTRDGLVQPAVQAPGDPNRDTLYDWAELTFDKGGLWLNSSQVDHFAIPHAVSVTNGAQQTRRTGDLVPGGRAKVFQALKNTPGWGGVIYTRADGTQLRALAPGKAADAGSFSPTYLDRYINDVWNTYRTQTLTVVPFEREPEKKFFGRTDASGQVMTFTDGTGKQVGTIRKPATADVWGCDGALVAPNDPVQGPIARSLCAAMNRTTLGRVHQAPTYDPKDFYQGQVTNFYSKIIHAHMVDGRAYGFAFDDVGAQESLVHDGDPRGAGIVLSGF